jgi:hypothetical protein
MGKGASGTSVLAPSIRRAYLFLCAWPAEGSALISDTNSTVGKETGRPQAGGPGIAGAVSIFVLCVCVWILRSCPPLLCPLRLIRVTH